ncbi:hypothetical protein T08_2868 [Trichinella sp. T8]|uniref:Uncharacterized protein n=1 Tax=Trichinella murrelli TaxID=144512 RepID=A0A0V0U7U3_9BILA|nr:hypothetical protein T05_14284 [Trichinella murrelli]KRZ88366.1 hypothetical protein T08_2868 [Trichinella sp. T8]
MIACKLIENEFLTEDMRSSNLTTERRGRLSRDFASPPTTYPASILLVLLNTRRVVASTKVN